MSSNDYRLAIKERVALYMTREKCDRQTIAERMDMPVSTFYTKLNGPSEFSFSEGKRLAGVIGCTVDEMFIRPS